MVRPIKVPPQKKTKPVAFKKKDKKPIAFKASKTRCYTPSGIPVSSLNVAATKKK